MKIIRPPKLKTGDTVGILAPSGYVEEKKLLPAITFLESMDFSVVLGSSIFKKNRYLAGSDGERVEDIHKMFETPEVKAIFSARGGYGSLRILNDLDYSLIQKNPKVFVGFSDTTALQLGIFRQTGLVGLSGLLLGTDIDGNCKLPDLRKSLFELLVKGSYRPILGLKSIKSGGTSGRIIVGCLSMISTLVGTPYLPNLDGAILIMEDVNEEPYRIDRMLTHLKLAGVFQKLGGLVFGQFTGSGAGESEQASLIPIFAEFAQLVNGPVLMGLNYGHISNRRILPIGVDAEITTNESEGKITF